MISAERFRLAFILAAVACLLVAATASGHATTVSLVIAIGFAYLGLVVSVCEQLRRLGSE